MADGRSSLIRSARGFFSGSLFSRITGLLRDIAMADAFGATSSLAAFMIAFRLAHLLRRVFGEGALQAAFIPHFEKLRLESEERAEALFRRLRRALTLLVGGLILASLTALAAFSQFLEGEQEVLYLTMVLLPSLLPMCLYGLNSALLNCRGSFFVPSAAPALFNLTLIAGCLALRGAEAPIFWFASFAVAASLFQWVATLPWIRFSGPIKTRRKEALRPLAAPFLLSLAGVAATQINSAVDPFFAAWASLEGPAYLWYAIRIQQLPLALFGIALSNAVLPPLSRLAESGDRGSFNRLLRLSILGGVGLMGPAGAFLLLFAPHLVELIYARGAFGLEAGRGTALCLQGYAWGLVPQTLVLLFASAFYAQKNYRIPAQATVLSASANLGLNAFFIFGLGMGAESVAYATSLSSLMQTGFLAGYFFLKNRGKEKIPLLERGGADLA